MQHSPTTQTLLQQTSANPVQGLVALHAWPAAKVARVVGAVQRPSAHTWPAVHCALLLQPPSCSEHKPSRQPGLTGHSPSAQRPPQQLSPWPHCRSEVQPSQRFAVQICPAAQSPSPQQSPALHRPPQHTEPAPHCAEVVQARQR